MTTLKIIIINIKSSLSALPQISSDNRSNTYIHTLFKCYCKKKIIIMNTLIIIIINIIYASSCQIMYFCVYFPGPDMHVFQARSRK